MTLEEEKQRIMELWSNNIKPEAKIDLSNLWQERRELGELEARVEALEPKIIKLLEVIPTLKRHSHEYHARTVDLVKLIHHFESGHYHGTKEEWCQRITEDLEYISEEINKIRDVVQRRVSVYKRPETMQQGFIVMASQSYNSMIKGMSPLLRPIYLRLNMRDTYQKSELHKIFTFDESQSPKEPFIAFINQQENYGLLYPNTSYHQPAMQDVFDSLTEQNWQKELTRINPLKIVRKSSSKWVEYSG